MVFRCGGYFRRLFKGYRGVTQVNPLSPTIFNVVVDAVISHWVTVVTPTDVGMGLLGLKIIDLAAFLYADGSLVALTQWERLQRAFHVLASLFGQVGLQTKTGKTVSMLCHPCHAPVRMSEEAYKIRKMGIGTKFW